MKVNTTIGSKDRFVEMFQRVNKLKLNEEIIQNNNSNVVLENAFNELKNNSINIQHTNNQENDNKSYVELVGVDKGGNNVTFRFSAMSRQGDQDGVFGIDNARLESFVYNTKNGGQTIEMDESALKQFNAQHSAELVDIVSNYIDVETETVGDELYEDAVKLIDKIPYKIGSENMVKHSQYADEKPTNPALRVNSDELKKFVSEDMNNLLHYSQAARDAGSQFKTKIGVTYQYVLIDALKEIGVKVLNIEDIDNETYQITFEYNGKKFSAKINNKRFGNAAKVRDVIKNKLKIGIVENEDDDFALPPEYSEEDAIEATDDINEPVDDTPDSIEPEDNEPVEDVSPEKAAIILQAYNNLIERNVSAPTMADVSAEIGRITGKPIEKRNRVYPSAAEPYLEETDYPEAMGIGKEFKPETSYPKPKKKHTKKVKIKTGVSESTDQDRYEEVVFLQGDEAYQPLEILDREGKDAAMEYLKQWHYPGEHMGRKDLGHGSSDYTYEKDGYIMSWNPGLEYIGLQYDLSQMNEEEMGNSEEQISHQPFDDEKESIKPSGEYGSVVIGNDAESGLEKLSKEKIETGDKVQGGLADEKSPTEFDPEQLLKGIEVEKEHTDDPMVAIEIAMDHLVEDPEYYTIKDNPEASAQAGAAADAEKTQPEIDNPELYPDGWKEMDGMFMNPNNPMYKKMHGENDNEMTDVLLGYEPKNVGDEMKDEAYDFAAQEVDYNNMDAYKKYQQYSQMDFDNLTDVQKEEFFELWKQFKGAEKDMGTENIQEESGFEEYTGSIGDRYSDAEGNEFVVRNKVKGGVVLKGQGGEKEVATSDVRTMKKLNEVKIAKKTLSNSKVPTGMTKKEAVQILIKDNVKKIL